MLDVFVGSSEQSVFAAFNFDKMAGGVYVRLTERDAKPKYSLLRDELRSAQPSNYAASLVRAIHGSLLVESAAHSQVIHLLLPLAD